MDLSTLTAISPLDGRYSNKISDLRHIASEYGLIYFRTLVEIHWIKTLSSAPDITEVPSLSKETHTYLEEIITKFNLDDAKQIKDIEKTTNHDVKAVEYFLQDKFNGHKELEPLIPFIHFGCTSEDINNVAYACMIQEIRMQCLSPMMILLIETLSELSRTTANMPMLSRTHGQTASPTTMGKEINNVVHRLKHAYGTYKKMDISAKFNGAVGNFNAHIAAYPDVDWPLISAQFLETLKLTPLTHSTQIEPHDNLAAMLHAIARINTILIDLNRDIWGYISLGYFAQRKVEGEVGSSTMPHKVNPIDFENSEGNLGIANALANHMASKLPISRWQRDLSDSTVLRNLGSVFGYTLIAHQSLLKGINKLQPNADFMKTELDQHWEVLGEAIQTVMRRYGITDAYEQLKALTRGNDGVTKEGLHALINGLDIPDDEKTRLRALTPSNYLGLAESMAVN
jgi:adenylosuccinate lyase